MLARAVLARRRAMGFSRDVVDHRRAKQNSAGGKKCSGALRTTDLAKGPSPPTWRLEQLVATKRQWASSLVHLCCCCSNVTTTCPEGGTPDTFLLPGSTIDQPSDSVTKAVTIYISSSSRPKDEGDENVQRLLEAVNSARTMLQLHAARAIVAFDGLQGKPSVTDEVARSYASKIRRVRTALPTHVDVLVHEMWLHQANSLRCAMLAMPRTPLVFVMQDDVQLASPVHTALLVPLLTASLEPPGAGPVVEYVRMSQKADCYDGRGRIFAVMTPCRPHPHTPWLHTLNRWTEPAAG